MPQNAAQMLLLRGSAATLRLIVMIYVAPLSCGPPPRGTGAPSPCASRHRDRVTDGKPLRGGWGMQGCQRDTWDSGRCCQGVSRDRAMSYEDKCSIDTEGIRAPCGQSPMDFESISLAARTHCLDIKPPPKARAALCSAAPLSHAAGSRGTRARVFHRLTLGLHMYFWRSDSEGIRTPAGRAQWISSPSP